jgi:hypothetical protein
MVFLGRTRPHGEPVAPTSTSSAVLQEEFERLVTAANSTARVAGLTHTFYRYPGRFSPAFARAAIENFSLPGDVVYDPFMGGGTVAVEALASGRRFIGTDINPLSKFLTLVKTTPLTSRDAAGLTNWHEQSRRRGVRKISISIGRQWAPYARHVPWWLRARIKFLLKTAGELANARQRNLAKCSVLRTAQWAMDGRRATPSDREFCESHRRVLSTMLETCVRLGRLYGAHGGGNSLESRRLLFLRSAEGIETDRRLPQSWMPVKLVLTSPPYPGVHVLYHRWQVHGRRETAAPFWIIGIEDGSSASHYTMGPRYAEDLSHYLRDYQNSFSSVAALLGPDSAVVQLIGFSNPGVQIAPVLDAMSEAGLQQLYGPNPGYPDAGAWRKVPNTKWYLGHPNQSLRPTGKEVVLVHRPKRVDPTKPRHDASLARGSDSPRASEGSSQRPVCPLE